MNKRIKYVIAVLVSSALASLVWGETKRHFHIHTIDTATFTVKCDGDGDPTLVGNKKDNTLTISCGQYK